jgi:type IX secretion system PorP/SprF family membrane protein
MVQAQDIHFSQFHAAPLNVNPAKTGVFDGDIRLVSNFRSQWASVPVSYTTTSFSYDQKLFNDGTLGDNGLGGGLFFNFDQAGDSELTLLQIGGSVAYAQQINKTNFVSIGVMAGLGQRRFNTANLTFDEQFIDGTFIDNAPITENFLNTSLSFVDMAIGVDWVVEISNRLKFNLGGSAWHLNQPEYSFFENSESSLPMKWGVNLDAVIQISETVDIMPSAIYFHQGGFDERLVGMYVRYHLDQRKSKNKAILFGTWYRLNDAVITSVAMDYGLWRVGISYDINTSPFSAATRSYGGFEISAQYIVQKVKPLEKQKTCPIF